MTDHKPLPVQGYTPQSQENVDLVNEGKILEERVLRWLDKVQDRSVQHEPVPNTILTRATFVYDQRFLAMGRSDIQKGFMLAYRAVFQPGRIKLPEDEA